MKGVLFYLLVQDSIFHLLGLKKNRHSNISMARSKMDRATISRTAWLVISDYWNRENEPSRLSRSVFTFDPEGEPGLW